MRKISLLLLIALSFAGVDTLIAQESEINHRDPQTWILGYFESNQYLMEPHNSWYNKEFDEYEIDNEAFIELSKIDLKGIEVLIVLGTWCPDSRREVPRFMKLTQLIGLDEERIKMLGTDNYKVAPIDNYDDLNIDRVPTFIFYKNKKELGRIIEYPEASLERDMVNIFKDL